jgi:hypothetical protein
MSPKIRLRLASVMTRAWIILVGLCPAAAAQAARSCTSDTPIIDA